LIYPFLPKKRIDEFKKCSVFSSKKKPLRLHASFKKDLEEDIKEAKINNRADNIVLFKYGDDLRQDDLVL